MKIQIIKLHINASASEPSDPFTVSPLEKIINHIPLDVC